jgi:hypothetical protein
MYFKSRKKLAPQFYWRTVKRWPAIHPLCCGWGLAVGTGCLNLFWTPGPNEREATVLKVTGILALIVYGWIIIAFSFRLARGTWSGHCDRGLQSSDGI